MGEMTWALSGVDTRRWNVQAGSLWRPPVTARRSTIKIPGRHGLVETGPATFEAPTLSLELVCEADDQAGLEAAQADLVALLTAPGLTVTRISAGSMTSAPATFESLSPGEAVVDSWARFTALLVIPGVFLRGPVATTDAATLRTGEVHAVSSLTGSTAPCTDAVLRVSGPLSVITVTDDLTGTSVHWAGAAVPVGSYLYLDVGALRAWRSTSSTAWAGGGTDASAGLDYGTAGALQLWPAMAASDPSVRTVTVTVTGTGFADTTALAVRAAPAYL